MTDEPVAVAVTSAGEGALGANVTGAADVNDVTPGPTGTPPEYGTGSIKRDPETLSVAVRTNIPDPESDFDWGVMTVDRGGHYAKWDEVSTWLDMFTTP